MINESLFSHFERQFLLHQSKTLLHSDDGRNLSYADIDATSARMANALFKAGARTGDRLSVQVSKSPEGLCLYLACLRNGIVYHPLNPAYMDSELEYFIGDAEPSIMICDPARVDAISQLPSAATLQRIFTLDAHGKGTLQDAAASCSPEFETVKLARDDLAALLYSSGTTGVPKGIMLTQHNLVSNTRTLVDAWEFDEQDCLVHALPIFHVHGLFVALGCVLLSGSSMHWLSAFESTAVLAALPECTVMMGVPTFYTRLLAEPRLTKELTAKIRLFISGSAPLLQETFRDFESRTGHCILERYGMTETNMNTSNPLHGLRKPGTVGPPLPGVDVCITDDAGKQLPDGEIGNLRVRGPNVFKGYWKLPEKTAEDVDDEGFFNTGDKALIDADGYVSIVGRAKDMVISGGLNVYPKEVELVLDELEGIRESAVVGVPHDDFGEAVIAVVVPEDGCAIAEDETINACKQKLANFKVPKRIVFVHELPRNTMAKVQKNRIRDTYKTLFGKEPMS